ncbi:hypothetical protein EDC96DRAFT_548919 [Choanephora cucurbitarum]|nr:hypothetical protein EDC96DRAFT_548919 [Choanephora cucurbitarum]
MHFYREDENYSSFNCKMARNYVGLNRTMIIPEELLLRMVIQAFVTLVMVVSQFLSSVNTAANIRNILVEYVCSKDVLESRSTVSTRPRTVDKVYDKVHLVW